VNNQIGSILLLLAVVSTSSPALAAHSVAKGVVQSFDAKACTVTLTDKTVYSFGNHCNLRKVKVGEKVMISWSMKGKLMAAFQLVATP